MRTKVPGGVDRTGAPVRRGHWGRRLCRGWSPCSDLLLTQGTVGLVRQARERFRLCGTLTLRPDGLGWCLESSTGWAQPEVRQHEAQPEQGQDHQLIVNEVRNHRIAPLHDDVGGLFYPVFKPSELSAAVGYIYGPARAVKGLSNGKNTLRDRCSHISGLLVKTSHGLRALMKSALPLLITTSASKALYPLRV